MIWRSCAPLRKGMSLYPWTRLTCRSHGPKVLRSQPAASRDSSTSSSLAELDQNTSSVPLPTQSFESTYSDTSTVNIPFHTKNTFSDAGGFRDLWSGFFEFQRSAFSPTFAVDMNYEGVAPQENLSVPAPFSFDPEMPSLQTQRIL
jgi:hypothetical protein